MSTSFILFQEQETLLRHLSLRHCENSWLRIEKFATCCDDYRTLPGALPFEVSASKERRAAQFSCGSTINIVKRGRTNVDLLTSYSPFDFLMGTEESRYTPGLRFVQSRRLCNYVCCWSSTQNNAHPIVFSNDPDSDIKDQYSVLQDRSSASTQRRRECSKKRSTKSSANHSQAISSKKSRKSTQNSAFKSYETTSAWKTPDSKFTPRGLRWLNTQILCACSKW